jgi:hypothetical protein
MEREGMMMECLAQVTYIRVVSDLLNDRVIEMARVTQEIRANLVCVLETLEDVRRNRELRPFPKLGPLVLALSVNVLHPTVML